MGTETRLISIASELSDVFKREAKEISGESDILQQGRGFMSEMGGAEQLGRCLAEDFKAARDAGNKTVVLGFHKLATALAEKSDAARQAISALSDVPDEDLHAALAEAAIALLINDQRFFEAAVVNVLQEQSDWSESLLNRINTGEFPSVAITERKRSDNETPLEPVGIEDYDPDREGRDAFKAELMGI
jgi:hypothetical protein